MKKFKDSFTEEQDMLRSLYPHLRFTCGDVVYWKTDKQKKIPMVIKRILNDSFDEDYQVEWFDSQKALKTDNIFDVAIEK